MHHYPEIEWRTALIMTVLNVAAVVLAILGDRNAFRRRSPILSSLANLERWQRWTIPVAILISLTIPSILIWVQWLPSWTLSAGLWLFLIVSTVIQLPMWRRKALARTEGDRPGYADVPASVSRELSPTVALLLEQGKHLAAADAYLREHPDASLPEVRTRFEALAHQRESGDG